jgi:AcrR family transcriptional regulator
MARPRKHDESTERRLLAAAESLLGAEGVKAFSLRRIATAASSTQRAIYSCFGGKAGLLQALYDQAFRELTAVLDALPLTEDAAADLVGAGVEGFRSWATGRPDLFRLLFESRPVEGIVEAGNPAAAEAWGRMEARVARCLAASGRPADGARPFALAFHVCCEGLATAEMRGMFRALPDAEPNAIWRATLEAVVRGFAPAST